MAEEQEGKKRKEEMVAGYLRFIIINIVITIIITIVITIIINIIFNIFLIKITRFYRFDPFLSGIF